MSKIELLAKIELLNKYEAMMEELKAEADTIRNSIKAEMEAREVEELIAGQYIVRYTSVLSNRFDSTAFKKVIDNRYPHSGLCIGANSAEPFRSWGRRIRFFLSALWFPPPAN